ncbi:hypothetical protein ACWFNE_14320 [Cellulomonas sp. NPDC055163]
MSAPDRFARSAALWLRAYPRRWRTARADEVTDVLRDLAAPGAVRVDSRAALSLVRSGWSTRWREHPPLGAWLRYRLLRERLPRQYRGWVRDDVDGRWFPVRMFSPVMPLWGLPVYVALLDPSDGEGWVRLAVPALLHTAVAALLWRTARRTGRRLYLARRPAVPRGERRDGPARSTR